MQKVSRVTLGKEICNSRFALMLGNGYWKDLCRSENESKNCELFMYHGHKNKGRLVIEVMHYCPSFNLQ